MAPLTDRDTNLPTDARGYEEATPTEDHDSQYRSMLEKKLGGGNGKSGQQYVSPSDAILSPASQKLANLKQRQINKPGSKNPAARALFARTVSSCSAVSNDEDTAGEKQ